MFIQMALFARQQPHCVHCAQPVDTHTNHVPGPRWAHVHCDFQHRQQQPIQPAEGNPQLRHWQAVMDMLGYSITGDWRDYTATIAERPDHAAWDLPSGPDRAEPHCPWLVVAQTPCPGGDWKATGGYWDGSFTCQHKHIHPAAGRIRQSTRADLW